MRSVSSMPRDKYLVYYLHRCYAQYLFNVANIWYIT